MVNLAEMVITDYAYKTKAIKEKYPFGKIIISNKYYIFQIMIFAKKTCRKSTIDLSVEN